MYFTIGAVIGVIFAVILIHTAITKEVFEVPLKTDGRTTKYKPAKFKEFSIHKIKDNDVGDAVGYVLLITIISLVGIPIAIVVCSALWPFALIVLIAFKITNTIRKKHENKN